MPKAMIITVGTGRNRQDIAGALLFSIQRQQPDFVRFLVSEISQKETLPIITQSIEIEHDFQITATINDVDILYENYLQQIKELQGRGFTSRDIIADYTSGTKAMSAALLSASIAAETGMVSYIHGERDSGGRVIPSTEQILAFSPSRILSERALEQAKLFFNINRFESCMLMCAGVKKSSSLKRHIDEACLLEMLAGAYDSWDRFEYKNAGMKFKMIKDDHLLKKYGVADQFNEHKKFLASQAGTEYSYERVVDLFENANRRFNEEGRYDDGLARLYRLFEYLAQVRLYQGHNKIVTEGLDIKKVPASLRDKYEKKRNKDTGRIQLSLVADYELLKDLDDPLGIKFIRDNRTDSSLRQKLRMRNDSILAHGISPITKDDALELKLHLEGYMTIAYPDWIQINNIIRFPRLNI